MLTIYQLMKYLRNHHSITVKGTRHRHFEILDTIMVLKDTDLSEIQASAFLSQVWMKLLL